MTVNFLGAIRRITGVRARSMAAATVGELLASLLEAYGPAWGSRVFDGRALVPGVVVMVNGINIDRMEGFSTPLGPEDRVDIFPFFDGG